MVGIFSNFVAFSWRSYIDYLVIVNKDLRKEAFINKLKKAISMVDIYIVNQVSSFGNQELYCYFD